MIRPLDEDDFADPVAGDEFGVGLPDAEARPEWLGCGRGRGVGCGSGPKCTPGPEALAGNSRIQPGSISLGFSNRPPFG